FETYSSFRNQLYLTDSGSYANWAFYQLPYAYTSLQCAGSDTQCQNYRDKAGRSPPGNSGAWNEDLSFMKSLAEGALAADSALYRFSPDSPAKQTTITYGTVEAPLVIAK